MSSNNLPLEYETNETNSAEQAEQNNLSFADLFSDEMKTSIRQQNKAETTGLANTTKTNSKEAYEKYFEPVIDLATKVMFQPEKLGNINQLKHSTQQDIAVHSEASALAKLNKILFNTGDPNMSVYKSSPKSNQEILNRGSYIGIGIESNLNYAAQHNLNQKFPKRTNLADSPRTKEPDMLIIGPIEFDNDNISKEASTESSETNEVVLEPKKPNDKGPFKLLKPLNSIKAGATITELDGINTRSMTYSRAVEILNSDKARFGEGVHLILKDSKVEYGYSTNIQYQGNFYAGKPIPGSPADKAGIKENDLIVAINGFNMFNTKHIKAQEIMTGKAGSDVELTIKRNGKTEQIKLKTESIKIPAVTAEKDLGNGVSYIRLSTFNGNATADMKEALLKHNNAKAFIIDLRNNAGGLLDQTINIASLFKDTGKIMSSKTRIESNLDNAQYLEESFELTRESLIVSTKSSLTNESKDKKFDRNENLVKGRPIVVLTNASTFSGGEALAAAIHEDNTSPTEIFGPERTGGKGTMQKPFKLKENDLEAKFTIGHFYSPLGNWFGDSFKQKYGVKASHIITNPEGTIIGSKQDHKINAAYEFLLKKISQ